MAIQLVRIKVVDSVANGLSGAHVRIVDEDQIIQAEGLTSDGPNPAKGIFETMLEDSAFPGKSYEAQVTRFNPKLISRALIQVRP